MKVGVSVGSRSEHSDEALRLALLKWMSETDLYHQKYAAKIQDELRKELDRQEEIKAAKKAKRGRDYATVRLRRQRLERQKPSHLVPSRIVPNGVRAYGNANGVGASYRLVTKVKVTDSGIEHVKVEERIE